MLELMRIVHFLSFSVAIGAGVSNLALGARMSGFPPQAMPQIGGYRLFLGNLSTICLILLWLTGIALIAATAGSGVFANAAFLWKLAAVLALTGLSITANLTIIRAKKSGVPPDASRMRLLGFASLTMAGVALLLAVLAFA